MKHKHDRVQKTTAKELSGMTSKNSVQNQSVGRLTRKVKDTMLLYAVRRLSNLSFAAQNSS